MPSAGRFSCSRAGRFGVCCWQAATRPPACCASPMRPFACVRGQSGRRRACLLLGMGPQPPDFPHLLGRRVRRGLEPSSPAGAHLAAPLVLDPAELAQSRRLAPSSSRFYRGIRAGDAMNTGPSPRFALFLLPFYVLLFDPSDRAAPSARRTPGAVFAGPSLSSMPTGCWPSPRKPRVSRRCSPRPGRASRAWPDPRAGKRGDLEQLRLPALPAAYQAEKRGFLDFNFANYLPQIVRYRSERMPPVATRSAFRLARNFDWTRDDAALYRYFFVRDTRTSAVGLFPDRRRAPALLKSAGTWSENI